MSLILADRPAMSGVPYDLASFASDEVLAAAGYRPEMDPAIAHIHAKYRQDSTGAGSAFFLRDLTDLFGRTFDVKFPELKIRQILPVYSGIDAGAEGYRWQQFNRVGTAKLINDYGADLPSAEVVAKEWESRIYSLGVSYNYSIQDLRKAKMAGIPLETRKAFAARRAMEQAVEQIGFFGVSQVPGSTSAQAILGAAASPSTTDQLSAFGLTNFPDLTGAMGTNDWTNEATAVSTIVADFNTMVRTVITQSDGVHTPNTIVLPLSTWTRLKQKPRSITFTEDSILDYLLRLNPEIKNVFYTPMLETAGLKQDNTTVGPRIMCFERNDENIKLIEPQPFEQLPPQMVNLTFKIPCHQRIAGVMVPYPLAFRYLDGTAG